MKGGVMMAGVRPGTPPCMRTAYPSDKACTPMTKQCMQLGCWLKAVVIHNKMAFQLSLTLYLQIDTQVWPARTKQTAVAQRIQGQYSC